MLQSNLELMPIIQRLGCLFLCLGRMVELEINIPLIAQDYNYVWMESKRLKYIDFYDRIINPDAITNLFLHLTDTTKKIIQVGQELDGKTIYWQWVKGTNFNYMIEMVRTYGIYKTHFRLCNNEKELIYDSYSFRDYKSEPSGRFDLYRTA